MRNTKKKNSSTGYRFDIITLFPESLASYLDASIIKRAQEKDLIEIHAHNIRDFSTDKHQTVDDTPYGGGAGMVLKIEPLVACLEHVLALAPDLKTRVLVTSAKGSLYSQAKARELASSYERLIIICGRYEGIDERFIEHFSDEEISIGEYVLTGGELPALVIADSITRLLPGVLGNIESSQYESHEELGKVEYPQYTKPEMFRDFKVPEVLLSGNHQAILEWRNDQSSYEKKNKN